MNNPDYLYIGHLSPDAKRVVRRSYAKFVAGVVEHGPLDLSKFDLPRMLGAVTQEVQDLNHYIAMLHEQVNDLLLKVAELRAVENGGE